MICVDTDFTDGGALFRYKGEACRCRDSEWAKYDSPLFTRRVNQAELEERPQHIIGHMRRQALREGPPICR